MPVITKISEQKRRPNRRNVFLDGRFAFGCNLNVIAKFLLREGMTLTSEQVQQIQQGEVRQECFDKAMGYIQRRLHSRSELQKKLTRQEYGNSVITGVLDDLARMNYLDDARFAQTRALSAAQHKGHGKRRAMLELMKQGIQKETAEKALNDVYSETNPTDMVRQLALKQAPRLKKLDSQTARRRLTGMLMRRGFDYDAIKPVIDEVLGGSD